MSSKRDGATGADIRPPGEGLATAMPPGGAPTTNAENFWKSPSEREKGDAASPAEPFGRNMVGVLVAHFRCHNGHVSSVNKSARHRTLAATVRALRDDGKFVCGTRGCGSTDLTHFDQEDQQLAVEAKATEIYGPPYAPDLEIAGAKLTVSSG